MTSLAIAPGLYFTRAPRPIEASPLRSDVAGFIGRTRRGHVGRAVRVEEWRGFVREFGGLARDADTTYSVRGYFENGGQIAYIVRLAEPFPSDEELKSTEETPPDETKINAATAQWDVGTLDPVSKEWQRDAPIRGGFRRAAYLIEATSPGAWANGTRVSFRYRLGGVSGKPEIDVIVQAPDEPIAYLTGLNPAEIEAQVASSSALIRLRPVGPEPAAVRADAPDGRRHIDYPAITLSGGVDTRPSKEEYIKAIERLNDEPEVALLATPDLYTDIEMDDDRVEILNTMIRQAEQLRDRLVLVDVPPPDASHPREAINDVSKLMEWAEALRTTDDEGALRAAATYHPRLWVSDPLGDIATPLRSVPPSGHVAGLISFMDRQRGAHHTPANAELFEAVDIAVGYEEAERALLNASGINLLRCFPGRGIQVWGGRTLLAEDINSFAPKPNLAAASQSERSGHFIAHRRLIHRLVRAIRRVAEPLVFDTNGPELWLTFVRAITTVLLEAFRAGALKGARPEEAFTVRCDAKTNPPEEIELGRVLCEIELAPAVPMEFILLRVALSGDGSLEVFES
ncbi:MAG TPA: phage tail sheath subtilisin-like domain-containing protein [Pyrinomonadaceae bacterium]|nr:phage tail sheath subtilisin-like domain-containing protein [Pyrinomonadaceae bacterium]